MENGTANQFKVTDYWLEQSIGLILHTVEENIFQNERSVIVCVYVVQKFSVEWKDPDGFLQELQIFIFAWVIILQIMLARFLFLHEIYSKICLH